MSIIRTVLGLGPSEKERLQTRVKALKESLRQRGDELRECRDQVYLLIDQVRLLKILADGSQSHPGYRGVYPPRVKESAECQAVYEARQELLRRGLLAPRSDQERKRLARRLEDA